MIPHKRVKVAAALAVTIVAVLLRLIGIGQFMTADEENWTIRSSGYWHNLFRNKDTGGAFMTTHPGATLMWVAGAGVAWQEQRLGLDADTSNIRHFRLAATLPVAITVSILIGIATWQAMSLFGSRTAITSGMLLATMPYLVGMSQIVHLDALLALLMLNAVLAFLLFFSTPTNFWLLGRSGIFTGLAFGAKLLPALWLFVFMLGYLVLTQRDGFHVRINKAARVFFLVAGIAALTFYVVWPALWFTDDIGRSFRKDVPSVLTDEHIALEESAEPIAPAGFYVRTVLGRTTPFILVLSVAGLITAGMWSVKKRQLHPVAWLYLYAAGYLLLVTLAAKKGDRYALPALAALAMTAGWALAQAFVNQNKVRRRIAAWIGFGVMLLALLAEVVVWMPYSIAYNNPYYGGRPASQQGWGEGLDAAAQWLNQRPNAANTVIASWYPAVIGTYFNGQTMSLSSRGDSRVAYVVTYRNMYSREKDDIASNVLDEFRDREPVKTVYIGDDPYVWIYSTINPTHFTNHVGEITTDVEVGQVVPVDVNNWHRVDIGFATFSSRDNTKDVTLTIKSSPDSHEILRQTSVNAADIIDGEWHTFEFEPLAGSQGKSFYVAVTSRDSQAGDAVTVKYSEDDIAAGQMLLRRRALKEGEQNSSFMREGDIAYQIK